MTNKRRFRVEDVYAHKALSAPTVTPDGRTLAFVATQPDLKDNKIVSDLWAWQEGQGAWQVTFGAKATRPQFSPRGDRLAFLSDRAGGDKQQVFVMGRNLCEGRKVTSMEGGVVDFRWSPDGRRIAFIALADKSEQEKSRDKDKRDWWTVDADERKQRLWIIPAEGRGKPVQVSADDEFVTAVGWTPDGKRLVYSACPRAITDSQLYEVSLMVVGANGRGRRKLCPFVRHDGRINISPDGRRALLSESYGPLDQWHDVVKTVDLATGRKTNVARRFDLRGMASQWLSDDEVLFEGEAGTGFRLFVCKVGGVPRALNTGEGVSASVSGQAAVAPRANRVFYVRSIACQPDEIYMRSLDGTGVLPWRGRLALASRERLARGLAVSSSSSSSSSVFSSSSPSSSEKQEREQDALATQGQDALATPVAVTNVNRGMAKLQLAAAEIVRWKSGRLDIEGLLYLPTSSGARKPYPLIVMPHGGPYGASSNSYGTSVVPNIYCAAGYACFLPNFRGSTGYGRLFTRKIVRDWGKGPFADIMSGVDSLIRRGVVDPKRMAVFGGSYGGYMTCWTVGHTNRFRCAVAVAAVTDLFSEWATCDIPTFAIYSSGGRWPSYADPFWRDQSPIYHVDKVKTPTLIITGEVDTRVPPEQSHEFYRALRLRGVKTRLLLYPREPHGVSEPCHRIHYFKEILHWIDEHVRAKHA